MVSKILSDFLVFCLHRRKKQNPKLKSATIQAQLSPTQSAQPRKESKSLTVQILHNNSRYARERGRTNSESLSLCYNRTPAVSHLLVPAVEYRCTALGETRTADKAQFISHWPTLYLHSSLLARRYLLAVPVVLTIPLGAQQSRAPHSTPSQRREHRPQLESAEHQRHRALGANITHQRSGTRSAAASGWHESDLY